MREISMAKIEAGHYIEHARDGEIYIAKREKGKFNLYHRQFNATFGNIDTLIERFNTLHDLEDELYDNYY